MLHKNARCFGAALIVSMWLGCVVASSAETPTLRGSRGVTSSNLTDTAGARRLQRFEPKTLDRNAPDVKTLNEKLDELRGLLDDRKDNKEKGGPKAVEGALATVQGFTEILDDCTESPCKAGQLVASGITLAGTVAQAAAIGGPAGPVLLAIGSILALIFGEAPTEAAGSGISLGDIKDAIFTELSNYAMNEVIEVEFPVLKEGKLASYITRLGGAVNYLQSDAPSGHKRAFMKTKLAQLIGDINPGMQAAVDDMDRGYRFAVTRNYDANRKSIGTLGQLLSKRTFDGKCEKELCPSTLGHDISHRYKAEWDSKCYPHLKESRHLLTQMFRVLQGYKELALMVFSAEVLLDMVYKLAGWDEDTRQAAGAKGARDSFRIIIKPVKNRYAVLDDRWTFRFLYAKGTVLEQLQYYCQDTTAEKKCNCGGSKDKYEEMLEGKCECDFEEITFVPPSCSDMCGVDARGEDNDGVVFFTPKLRMYCQKHMDIAVAKLGAQRVAGTCGRPCAAHHSARTLICARRKACASSQCRGLIQAVQWLS